jgi:hypothetical protein
MQRQRADDPTQIRGDGKMVRPCGAARHQEIDALERLPFEEGQECGVHLAIDARTDPRRIILASRRSDDSQ